MLNLNPTTLQAVADKALIDAAAHPRWIAAIGRALVELDANPWIERGDHAGAVGDVAGSEADAGGCTRRSPSREAYARFFNCDLRVRYWAKAESGCAKDLL